MKLIKDDKKHEVHTHFDNLEELIDFLEDHKHMHPVSHAMTDEMDSDFCKYSMPETMDMMRNGWTEGVTQMEAITKEIEGSGTVNRSYIKYDVYGNFANIGRVLTGEPECCGRKKKRKVKNNEVNILVNVSAMAFVPAQCLINRGAAIQALINGLMEKNHVNLKLARRTNNVLGYNFYTTIDCDTRNFYSKELLAFVCGNPAFLRRACFRISEIMLNTNDCEGYGRTSNYTPEEIKAMGIDIYMPGLTDGDKAVREWGSTSACMDSLNKIIKQFNKDHNIIEEKSEPAYVPPPPKREKPVSGKYGNR